MIPRSVYFFLFYLSISFANCNFDWNNPKIQFYADNQNSLNTPYDLPQQLLWQNKNEIEVQGFYDNTLWVKYEICNQSPANQTYLIEIQNHFLDTLEAFILGKTGKIEKKLLGNRQRTHFDWPFPTLKTELSPLKSQTIYFRIRSETLFTFPLKTHKLNDFAVTMHYRSALYGFFVGLVFLSSILGLLYAFAFSNRDFLMYSIYSLVTIICLLFLNGYLFVFFPIQMGNWDNKIFIILGSLQFIMNIRFFEVFLQEGNNLNKKQPFFIFLYIFISTPILWVCLGGSYSAALIFLQITHPIFVFSSGVYTLYLFKSQQRQELFLFFLGQAALVIGVLITIQTSFSILPPLSWKIFASEIFYAFNALCFGTAFTLRFKRERQILRQTAEIARDNLLQQTLQNEENMRHHLNRTQHFAHVISHDLRSPVATIIGYIDLIKHTGPRKEIIEKTSILAKSMDSKLRELNEILKIESQQLPTEEVDFVPLLQIAAKETEELRQQKRINLRWDLIDTHTVWGTSSLLQSIFFNLLENAIKFSDKENSTITLRSFRKGYNIAIEFCDEGLGIDLERYQNRLFSLYERLHPGIEGSGKGLYLSRVHLEQMNGKIEVESKINQGSTFRVWLSQHHLESRD